MGNHLSSSNPVYPDVPLNEPPFRWSSDLSYWDASLGSFGDSTRRWIWLFFGVQNILATVIIGFVLLSILINKEARKKPFNLFLMFLMIPDLVFSGGDLFIYFLNYTAGRYISVAACKVQSFLLLFGATASCQVNALIAVELHRMLRHSNIRRRYFPPSKWAVTARCLMVYVAVACVSVVYSLNFNALSMRTPLSGGGIYCVAAPYDTRSALVYYIFPSSMFLWVPGGICTYVTVDVLRRGLLPKKGEGKRALTVYFFRLLFIFVFFWFPAVLSAYVATNPWLSFVGASWSHVQGAVSALAMLGKSDVYDCAQNLLSLVTSGLLGAGSSLAQTENSTHSSAPNIAMDDFSEHQDPEDPYLQEEDAVATGPVVFENEPPQSD
mmetsp:Transcript_10494/g.25149  ORF Transcript_10494/g.25149 Transcript_10494/m.25149 type:complete len:381 (-) Transcript_10494:133-1275(-)